MARKISKISRKKLVGAKRRKAGLPKSRRKSAVKKVKLTSKRRYSR